MTDQKAAEVPPVAERPTITSVLLEAAKLMRELAQGATPSAEPIPGGWAGYVMDSGQSHLFGGPAENGYRTGTVMSFSEDCDECGRPSEADMQHIAGWHPAVALAVAGWLHAEAVTKCTGDRYGVCRPEIDSRCPQHYFAYKVARAYLGPQAGPVVVAVVT